MLTMLSCYNLFLREVSKKKLQRLVELAHHDPDPLEKALKEGYFRSFRKDILRLLEEEKKKAKYSNTKQNFQNIINMIQEQNSQN